ncbi:zinc ribbon domain-containing protein [Christensenellaceae bacterium OttesenSCG-928-K19]|nr:zinc ribbon domain-containing protein [Christensenellaceae bacterium OttesenSCG-928-K19]
MNQVKSYVGLKRAAMVIMYILAALQLIGSISSAMTYTLDAGSMAWNWIWAAIGFIAAILLTMNKKSMVMTGALIALASGTLSLISSIYSLSAAGSMLADFGLDQQVTDIAMGVSMVFMVIGSCIYFLVFILGFIAARRMKAPAPHTMATGQSYAYQQQPEQPQQPAQQPSQAGIFCSSCGAPNSSGAAFCSKCGGKLQQS